MTELEQFFYYIKEKKEFVKNSPWKFFLKDSINNNEVYEYRQLQIGTDPFAKMEWIIERKTNQTLFAVTIHGGILPIKCIEFKPEDIHNFLERALLEKNNNSIFRGPKRYDQPNSSYHNNYQGTFESFEGIEIIMHQGISVYKANYSGGIVK
ncbi:hypothetical protein HYV79_00645 [Candidatus Woesearchaeota archaeon]|nr:hypothetical protein [Candidatus Woesearchaeota archaeon]